MVGNEKKRKILSKIQIIELFFFIKFIRHFLLDSKYSQLLTAVRRLVLLKASQFILKAGDFRCFSCSILLYACDSIE